MDPHQGRAEINNSNNNNALEWDAGQPHRTQDTQSLSFCGVPADADLISEVTSHFNPETEVHRSMGGVDVMGLGLPPSSHMLGTPSSGTQWGFSHDSFSTIQGASIATPAKSSFAHPSGNCDSASTPPPVPSYAPLSKDHFECSCPLYMLVKDIERALSTHRATFEISGVMGARYECSAQDADEELMFDINIYSKASSDPGYIVEIQQMDGCKYSYARLVNQLTTTMRYCSIPLKAYTANSMCPPAGPDLPTDLEL